MGIGHLAHLRVGVKGLVGYSVPALVLAHVNMATVYEHAPERLHAMHVLRLSRTYEARVSDVRGVCECL